MIVGVDTDQGRLDKMVAGLRDAGGRAHARRADALDAAQVQGVVDAVVAEHGRIDVLVNAVGGSTIIDRPAASVDDLTLADWQRLLHFNLTGTFLFCHAVVPVMKRQRRELGPFGVNVNAIAPSLTLTERVRPHWERRTPEQQAREIDHTPLRRVAEARDQARVICFLASADADFVTGVTIDVTGGV